MESTSLVKALAVIEATAADPAGRSLSAICAEVGLPKPTTHRILKTLLGLGYLEQSAAGEYRQTPRIQRLVSNDPSERLTTIASPVLQTLHDATRETVNLGVLRGDRVVYLRVLESTQPLRRVATPNSVDPFHTTALGRAIVSHLPESSQDGLIRRAKLESRTPHSKVNPQSLKKILRQAAQDGYAIETDETDLGVTCIGAPLIENEAVVGAISISVPSVRAKDDALAELIHQVSRAAEEITARLSSKVQVRKVRRGARAASVAGEKA